MVRHDGACRIYGAVRHDDDKDGASVSVETVLNKMGDSVPEKGRLLLRNLMLNGVLAGLVAVTAPCAWIEAWAAVVIGLIAGILVVIGVYTLEGLKVDDPVGAVSVHGVNGIWGLISVGIFADGTYGNYLTEEPFVKGLLYGGGAGQLIAQVIGAAAAGLWAFLCGYIVFKVLDAIMGIRVSPHEEIGGLDVVEHGGSAYPDFYTQNK